MNDKILKYFDPELSSEEKYQLLNEINSDSALKEEFESYLKIWNYSSLAENESDEVDVEKEFNIISNRLGQLNSSEHVVPLRLVLQYAAVVLLLLGLGVFGYLFFKPDEQVAYNEIVTNTGEKAQITLSDGTKIWLNASSKLRYPSQLSSDQVHVYLQGEAYFDVKHNEKRLFQVHAANLYIKVLGTAFNVKSYPEERIVETTLIRGKVRIESKSNKPDDYVILKPNQKASYVGSDSRLVVTQTTPRNIQDRSDDLPQIKEIALRNNSNLVVSNNVNTKFETSWKDGRLEFVDEQFATLASKMERWFGVKISIQNSQLEKVRYTGTFEKETVEQALHALSMSLPFKYKICKDSIKILKQRNNYLYNF